MCLMRLLKDGTAPDPGGRGALAHTAFNEAPPVALIIKPPPTTDQKHRPDQTRPDRTGLDWPLVEGHDWILTQPEETVQT